jgi:glucose-6-phosphate 1-dehydrogenase
VIFGGTGDLAVRKLLPCPVPPLHRRPDSRTAAASSAWPAKRWTTTGYRELIRDLWRDDQRAPDKLEAFLQQVAIAARCAQGRRLGRIRR